MERSVVLLTILAIFRAAHGASELWRLASVSRGPAQLPGLCRLVAAMLWGTPCCSLTEVDRPDGSLGAWMSDVMRVSGCSCRRRDHREAAAFEV